MCESAFSCFGLSSFKVGVRVGGAGREGWNGNGSCDCYKVVVL